MSARSNNTILSGSSGMRIGPQRSQSLAGRDWNPRGRRRWGQLSLAGVLLLGASARHARAQEWNESHLIPDSTQFAHIVIPVTPDSVLVTDEAPTATITVTNRSEEDYGKVDSSHIFFGPECEAGEYAYLSDFYTLRLTVLHRLPLDPITAAWRNGGNCAAAWLTGYPRMLYLGPHEQRTFTLKIVPPATLPNGRYIARLIYAGAGSHEEVDVIYIRTAAPAHRVRWHPTPSTGLGSGVVQAEPAMLVLDNTTRATTFTLVNHSTTPKGVWLYVDCPWFMVNYASYGQRLSQYEATWHSYIPSLALYLGGMPQYVVLAPHERRSIPVALIPSWGTKPVENSYARVRYTEAPVALGDTAFTIPQGAITVVYAPDLALTLARPAVHVLGDTQKPLWLVCDTLREPGLGFVADIHAEVHDATGHVVTPLGPALFPSSQWRVGVPWTFDTTVVVWNVKHDSRSLRVFGNDDANRDGLPRPPAPVCFWLPRFAPGQYQFVMQGFLMQDVEHRHPVQTTVPLDIP